MILSRPLSEDELKRENAICRAALKVLMRDKGLKLNPGDFKREMGNEAKKLNESGFLSVGTSPDELSTLFYHLYREMVTNFEVQIRRFI